MRIILLAAIFLATGAAQPQAILQDLEDRALAALKSAPRAYNRTEVVEQRAPLRRKLERSLGFDRPSAVGSAPALLYLPEKLDARVPAVIIVRPHEDPKSVDSQVFADSLARLGFVVLHLDMRAHHTRLDLLPNGVTPQGLMQRDIRSALTYFVSRADVDPKRIGLAGTGLAVTVAAAVNEGFSAIAVTDGGPDFREQLRSMRALRGKDLPDTCALIPGLLRYAATEELLALIAPRPMLTIQSSPTVAEYTMELYRSFGAAANLQQLPETGSVRESRFAAYRWFARWLQDRPDISSFTEIHTAMIQPIEVQLPSTPRTTPIIKQPLTLPALLGDSLPRGFIGYGLQVTPVQNITLNTQRGVETPVTVYRPGPEGGNSDDGFLIAIHDEGRAALSNDPIVREALRRNWTVWAVDPRGIGDMKTESESFLFAASLLLGENLVWRQAADLERIAGGLGFRNAHHRLGIYANGKTAALAATYLAAVAARDVPSWIVLRNSVSSLSNTGDVPLYVPAFDALSMFDIPDLLAAAKPKIYVITQPDEFINAEW